MPTILGIDLGTTNSVVAVYDADAPRILLNDEGQRITPSVVSWQEDGSIIAGAVARRQRVTQPGRTIASAKRLIGRKLEDCAALAEELGCTLVAGPNGEAAVAIDDLVISPQEVAAHILAKLRRAAEQALGEDLTDAVITVPAYFDDAQRQATRQAGTLAGLNVRRILNEPTAAALAAGLDRKGDRTVAVFDFGGGTFDISILDIGNDIIEVRSTAGDTRLGGDDIDERIVRWLAETFEKQHGTPLTDDRQIRQRLRDAAERAKIELSSAGSTDIHLPFLAQRDNLPVHLTCRLERSQLEHMISDLVGRTIVCCERAIEDAGLDAASIDEVLLVGGSTRIPLVRERVEAFFGSRPDRSANPEEVVALGAAVQGAILAGTNLDMLLLDVTPLSLGVETRGGLFTRLIERNTTIPTRARKTFGTAADNQHTVEIHVLQGEREFARDNRSLGRFDLAGIPRLPRGQARVEVSFDIDANGIVSVSARETTTDKAARIVIRDAASLEATDVERIVKEAQKQGRRDREARQEIEQRGTVTAYLERLEHPAVQDLPIPPDDRERLGEVISAAREWLLNRERPFQTVLNMLHEGGAIIEDARIAAGASRWREEQEGAALEGQTDAPAEDPGQEEGTSAVEGEKPGSTA